MTDLPDYACQSNQLSCKVLRDEIERLRAEVLEQCRLNGMGGSREAKLRAERDQMAGVIKLIEDILQDFDGEHVWQQAQQVVAEHDKLRTKVEQQRLELGITEDACGMLESEVKQLRARVAELEAALEVAQRHIDFFDPVTKCARCGVEERQTSMVPEEGDEWECFVCWERENARERAAAMKESSR